MKITKLPRPNAPLYWFKGTPKHTHLFVVAAKEVALGKA